MSTNEDTLRSLGKLLAEGQGERDAVHIAVVPMTAAMAMPPGTPIMLMEDGRATEAEEGATAVGVVDPFLADGPNEGGRFWVFLTPGSITSLRHDWTHPAFPDFRPDAESRAWLDRFCDENRIGYEELVKGAVSGEGACFSDDSGPENARGGEFWSHIERVTGRRFDDNHRDNTYFRCAC